MVTFIVHYTNDMNQRFIRKIMAKHIYQANIIARKIAIKNNWRVAVPAGKI